MLLYIVVWLFIGVNLPGLADVLSSWPGIVLTVVIGFGLLFWFVWQYENWRNDLYILTPDRPIDYQRTPFGLQGTTQKTANLATVQNVTATTKGFIDTLFNMGDVLTIRTGGVDNELLFARVWNPRQVQSDIVKALEEFQNAQRAAEDAKRRGDFIEWIGIYDELTRIHTAQTAGVTRRTPCTLRSLTMIKDIRKIGDPILRKKAKKLRSPGKRRAYR